MLRDPPLRKRRETREPTLRTERVREFSGLGIGGLGSFVVLEAFQELLRRRKLFAVDPGRPQTTQYALPVELAEFWIDESVGVYEELALVEAHKLPDLFRRRQPPQEWAEILIAQMSRYPSAGFSDVS